MFKVGDIINYSFYSNIKVVCEDEECYLMEDKNGNTKKLSKRLVNKYGKLVKVD